MEQLLNSLLTQSSKKQKKVVFINKNRMNREYSLFQIHLNQLQKCQQPVERLGEQSALKQSCIKRQNKSPLIRKQYTNKDLQNKQMLSMPQQLHQRFIQQKEKELVQFLTICLTILSLIVMFVEYHQQENYRRFYDN
ncbi:unnamed protein product (macronuclear) [Paramecium tetraurelia]|uniref:Transmembrane protein n=1 Tax=Paramecium tetraurelia TaxID=5888 RepID=A0C677_PARTE|nr:uncharacterized protein GSPATT00035423001 [Paramecium tetraurelia]CAK66294.1 unnamed protein product [Paramecium tetraurelia]|eukprot:XP_001433691.1 hypothetical protein (macronuclear) [Paramecium tetraurelia strain d4-2]